MKQRIDPSPTAIAAQVHGMIDFQKEHLAAVLKGYSRITMDLTGGVDSRTLLALIRQVRGTKDLTLECAGGQWGADCSTAKKIARLVHIDYKPFSFGTDQLKTDGFVRNARIWTLFNNGVANALYAIRPPFRMPEPGLIHIHATFGECIRGFYYWLSDVKQVARYTRQEMSDHLGRMVFRHDILAILDPQKKQDLFQSLDEVVERLTQQYAVNQITDVMDLFYLFERTRNWGRADAYLPQVSNRYTPYLNTRFLQAGMQLPSPIGTHGFALFVNVVRDFMPEVYQKIPTVPGSQDLNPLLKKSLPNSRWMKILDYYRQRTMLAMDRWVPWIRTEHLRDAHSVRGDFIASHLDDILQTLVTAPDALIRLALTDEVIQRNLQQHMTRQIYRCELMSVILGLELWKEEIKVILQRRLKR